MELTVRLRVEVAPYSSADPPAIDAEAQIQVDVRLVTQSRSHHVREVVRPVADAGLGQDAVDVVLRWGWRRRAAAMASRVTRRRRMT